ncbi:MAG TPA: dienelactone hydrolase family protein [Euzebyales bacterium]|nr:dienelactone hydrolase family protein [Euzebyales bacterium]
MNDRLDHRFTTPQGDEIGALLRRPASGSGPGLLLVQEIFGVSDYLEFSAERLARLGYVVLAPDLYWRIEAGADISDNDTETAFGFMSELDAEAAVGDLIDALGHVRGLDGVTGGTGILGFCLGGSLAYNVASQVDPDTCVSYYGSAIPDALDAMAGITCPILFHFGEEDQYTPVASVDRVDAATEGMANVRFERYPTGGHAFDNAFSDTFHQPRNAVTAWGVTAQFLQRTLPAA